MSMFIFLIIAAIFAVWAAAHVDRIVDEHEICWILVCIVFALIFSVGAIWYYNYSNSQCKILTHDLVSEYVEAKQTNMDQVQINEIVSKYIKNTSETRVYEVENELDSLLPENIQDIKEIANSSSCYTQTFVFLDSNKKPLCDAIRLEASVAAFDGSKLTTFYSYESEG